VSCSTPKLLSSFEYAAFFVVINHDQLYRVRSQPVRVTSRIVFYPSDFSWGSCDFQWYRSLALG
jgi:hypothetical protein